MKISNDFYETIKKYDICGQAYNCTRCGACGSDLPRQMKCALGTKYLGTEAYAGSFNLIIQDVLDGIYPISDDIIDYIYRCSTCNYCELVCTMLSPRSQIEALRAQLIEQGSAPKTIKKVLDDTANHGNEWGKPQNERGKWADDLSVKHISEVTDPEFLLFLDSSSAYIERNQETAKKLVEILNHAGVRYGILGKEEICDGNDILRIGETGLFEKLAQQNIAKFKEYGVKKIVTPSPHSFHALKNEYPKIDENYNVEVMHSSQLLCELETQKRLKPTKKLGKTATYHDPCYLARHNSVVDEPRQLINSVLMFPFKEMMYNKNKAICCGGGGGCLWIERDEGVKMEELRLNEAIELGVETFVTSCPICTQQFESAKENLKASIEIKDVIDLVYEAL